MAQKSVLRAMCGVHRYDHVSHLFDQLGILTVPQLYKYCVLIHVLKYQDSYPVHQAQRVTGIHCSPSLGSLLQETNKL